MPRVALFRLWQAVVLATTVSIVVWALVVHSLGYAENALFLGALVLVATFLRSEAGEEAVGFEASIAFGGFVLFPDPAIRGVSVLLGGLGAGLFVAVRTPRISM